jgi:rSAM/selenodomain-associated transferase 1
MAHILIFAKPPINGKVKTRLIADLGESVATEIYRYCLAYTLDLVFQSGFDYRIWLTEESNDPIFQQQPYSIQQGPDLGFRMLQAIGSQLRQQKSGIPRVILIGSDCLDMNTDHLQQASAALNDNDIVLLPTLDGGYALIACRKIEAQLFTGVKWGSSSVFEQTLNNARGLDYRVSILETVRDIDTLQDVNHYAELKSLVASNAI